MGRKVDDEDELYCCFLLLDTLEGGRILTVIESDSDLKIEIFK